MKKNQVNEFALKQLEPLTFPEFFNMVKGGKIVPLYDDHDNLVGFHTHADVKGVRYSKIVKGMMTVGATEEERQKDEENLLTFMEQTKRVNVMHWLAISLKFNAAEIHISHYINGAYIDLNARKAYNCAGEVIADYSDKNIDDEIALELFNAKFA